jgi:hypothetical protein
MYVPGYTQINTNTDIVSALAFPQPVSGCTSKLYICFAYAVSAFAFPQLVSDCAYKLKIPLLMLFLHLPSHSM